MRAISYLENGWTDWAEICYVVRDPLVMYFTQTKGGAHLHVHTCEPLFRISGTTGRIALKFGVLLDPLTMHFTHAISGGYIQVRKCSRTSFLSISVRFRSFIAQEVLVTGTYCGRQTAWDATFTQ